MLISIIIPVYNTSEYLRKCVDSIISEDLSDCEVILVDDGSTDNVSGPLCDEIAEKHDSVRVIHQQNKGLGGARNTGITESNGEYLFFVDSDDFLAENTISRLKSSIEKTNADIIAFNFAICDDNGIVNKTIANFIETDMVFALEEQPTFLLSLPSACCRVWKKKLFADNDIFFPAKVWYEDIRTTSKLFAVADSISTLNDAFYCYYQREGSIMRSDNIHRNREIIDAFDDLLAWYKKQDLFERYKDVLCRLCIDNLYIAASVRVLRADSKNSLLKEFSDYLRKEFPHYKKNPYINELSKTRKLVYNLLEMRMYKVINLLFKIREKV